MVLAAITLFTPGGFCQAIQVNSTTLAKKFQNMIGLWEIAGEQDAGGGLEIIDSATILIRFMGEEKKLIDYKIDFTRSPMWFDFSAKDSAATLSFKSLVEFVNDDMLKWEIFTEGERTDHFTSAKGELYYLKRAAPKSNGALYSGNR